MRIGLTGGGASVDRVVRQAKEAEADGFSALWYASIVTGDPLVAMAIAGRETSTIELGTAVLQTSPCHPLLQANRVSSVVDAMGRPGFTLGIGPSHEPVIRGAFGMSYDHPGRSTDEYLQILTALLRGENVDFDGSDWSAHTAGRAVPPSHPVPVLVSALGPRLLRVAGEHADGTVLWMADERAVANHVVPRITKAADNAGRPAPRIVAGIPVCLCAASEVDAAKERANRILGEAEVSPNYQRLLDYGDARDVGDICAAGDEDAILARMRRFADAGVTDLSVRLLPIGDNRDELIASKRRTRQVISELGAQLR